MNVKRILIGLLLIVLLAGGGFLAYQHFFASESAEEETAVDPDTISINNNMDKILAEGELVPLRDASLAFRGAGTVAEILVHNGDSVEKGDPLLRLDAVDQEIGLQQAQAGLVQAEANLVTVEAGVLAAETAVSTAKVAVSAAEAALALIESEATAEQIAASEASVDVAAAGVTQAAGSRDAALEGATAAQIRAAEAQLRAAQAALKPIQDAYGQASGDDLEQLSYQLNAATAQVNAAQATLDELKAGATASEQQAAYGGVAAAAAQRDASQAQLDLLLAGAKPEQITAAKAGVEQAEAAVAEAELGLEQAQTAVTQAEARVVEAETAVAAAQEALDQMTLIAPFAGTVADVAIEVGELAAPGTAVVILADFSGWQIKTTDLTELEIVAVKKGLPVKASIDALPNDSLHGTVSDIADNASFVRGDVTYVVTIDVKDDPALPLRWGMTVFVEIDNE